MKKQTITRTEYDQIHPDYKWLWNDWIYRIMKLINWETVSVPVEIIEDQKRN